MKRLWITVFLLFIVLTAASCKEKTETSSETKETATTTDQKTETPILKAPQIDIPKAATGMEPIPLELPKPAFVGTPENIEGVENLEKPLGKARPPFLAPEGTELISRNKPVIADESELIIGEYAWIVDGDKKASEGSLVEMGPMLQQVTIDLEDVYEIYAVVAWHFHKVPRVYFDVIVQISTDEEFITDVTTIYNNDLDNSAGLGVGTDNHYVETAEGRLIDAKGIKGRYVRLYSGGNNSNDMNHYVEVEVFGRKAQ